MINDILDFSKIEAGKLDLEPTDFDCATALGDTMKTLAVRAHQKGLELAVPIRPDVPESLVGDSGRLRQIWSTWSATPSSSPSRAKSSLRVEVRDRRPSDVAACTSPSAIPGIGIPADKQALIFEAFARRTARPRGKYGGTGLGLAISAQLVELMGGRIWVESELGPGQHVPLHRCKFGVRAGRRRPQPRIAARACGRRGAGRGRQCHQPPDPRRNARAAGG